MPDSPQDQHAGTPEVRLRPQGAPGPAARRGVAASIDIAASALRAVRSRTGAVVLTDLPCPQCGYNMRGLDTGGACPECGTRVSAGHQVTPDAQGALPPVADTLESFGRSHLATATFVLFVVALVMHGGGCFAGLATAFVGLGSLYRVATLWGLARSDAARLAAVQGPLRGALTAYKAESATGLLFACALFFDAFEWLPPQLAETAITVCAAAWGGVLGLGMIASALLADAVSRQYALNVTRSMVPLRAAIAAPIAFAACAIACECYARFPDSAMLALLALGTVVISVCAWLLAAWAACAYMVGTVEALRGSALTKRTVQPIRMTAPPPPPATTDKARAARKLLEDDTPIPMD